MDNNTTSLRDAVYDTAQMFGDIYVEFGVEPEVTMDILRLHMMYMSHEEAEVVEEDTTDE